MERGIQYEGTATKVAVQPALIADDEDLTRTVEHNVAALVGYANVPKSASSYVQDCVTSQYILPKECANKKERHEQACRMSIQMSDLVTVLDHSSLSHNKVKGFKTSAALTTTEKTIRNNFVKEARDRHPTF